MRRVSLSVAAACGLGVLVTFGAAASAPAQAQTAGWTLQVTPYVWATGVGGTIRPGGGAPEFRLDKSFGDVLEDLDGALFLSALARRDRFVIFGDFSYSSSSREATLPPGLPVEGSLRQTSLTVAGGYRVIAEPAASLDLLAGARAWSIRGTVDAPAIGRSATKSVDFVDPILAVRALYRFAPDWSVLLYADVGGFGVGSELTTQIAATVNRDLSDRLTLSLGYRQLDVDYRAGGGRIDARLAGPILGASFRF